MVVDSLTKELGAIQKQALCSRDASSEVRLSFLRNIQEIQGNQ